MASAVTRGTASKFRELRVDEQAGLSSGSHISQSQWSRDWLWCYPGEFCCCTWAGHHIAVHQHHVMLWVMEDISAMNFGMPSVLPC